MHGLAQDGDKPYAPTGRRPTVRAASVEDAELALPTEASAITWDSQVGQVFRSMELINSAVEAGTDPIYQRHGINRADYPILDALFRQHPTYVLAPTQLARQLTITTGALTPRLDRLEASGLIQRLSVPRDRRRLHIQLTAAGHRCVGAVSLGLSSHLQEAVQSMGRARLNELASLLRALEKCVQA
ncbi:MarR family winged helix-turn-helix transcriptional regulator [Streptomyces massasporeus]|uniref:MarR family winged helix-turn-helix transcriptional regulator n=1 Tax=Streptomyces massasporeus TaxID=67324 RepID=A0ABW6LD95_9ACTN